MNPNRSNPISPLQCTPIVGHGFVLDKYRCQCRKGFYHPNRVALNGYKGKFRILVRWKNIPWKVSQQNFWCFVFSWQTRFCLFDMFLASLNSFPEAGEVIKPQSKDPGWCFHGNSSGWHPNHGTCGIKKKKNTVWQKELEKLWVPL